MIFQLCNICSTSLCMATARTWYFAVLSLEIWSCCPASWSAWPVLPKTKTLATCMVKLKGSPVQYKRENASSQEPWRESRYGLRIVHWRTWWKGKKENQCKGREAGCWWLFQITPPPTRFCHVRISFNYSFPLGHTSFWKSFSNPFFGYHLNAKLSSCLTI